MTRIQLEPDAVQLLRDVQAGKVARHRINLYDSPADGADYQQDLADLPLRRAKARLQVLRAKGLVELPKGAPDDTTWPWRTTELGDTVIRILNGDAEPTEPNKRGTGE